MEYCKHGSGNKGCVPCAIEQQTDKILEEIKNEKTEDTPVYFTAKRISDNNDLNGLAICMHGLDLIHVDMRDATLNYLYEYYLNRQPPFSSASPNTQE